MNDRSAESLVYLVSCAVNGAVPDTGRVSAMDLKAVYDTAGRHMLRAAAAAALSSAGVRDPDFTEAYAKAVRKTALLNAELSALERALNTAGIAYLPLKGAVLQKDYPLFGLREMSDVDILIDPSRAGDVREIMERLGFTAESFDRDYHDVYHKPPVCSFEIHRTLFSPVYTPVIRDYYSGILARLLPGEGTALRMSDEDFYVYMIAHGYKHFSLGGTGLRSALDIYVYLKKHAGLDRGYIEGELEKLGLREHEALIRELSLRLFGGEAPAEGADKMLRFLVDSGAYGRLDTKIANAVKERGVVRYVLSRAFLPMFYVKKAYPWFYAHRAALPLLPFYRLWLGLTRRRSSFRRELTELLRNRKK